MYIISIFLFFPVGVYMDNADNTGPTYLTDFGEINHAQPFWLSMTFTCSLIVLPYYAVHTIWYAYLYPQFLPKED